MSLPLCRSCRRLAGWFVKTMGCGGYLYVTLDNPSVEISSPNYPSPPTLDADCEWVVLGPSGSRLRLDFESEIQLGPSCMAKDNAEFLLVSDGGTENAPPLRLFCGNEVPSSVLSTENAMHIHFVSGSDNRGSGFKASVRMAQCGGTIHSMIATIQSPNWPQNYGSSVECEWFLKMKDEYHMILTIQEMETPTAANCSLTDYLEIRNMDDQGIIGDVLGTYCGRPSELPIVVQVPGPYAYVKFKSNSAVTAKGFSMKMVADLEEGCGATLEAPSGVITSPRYPGALNAARGCYWRILAPPGRKVKITFNEMNLPFDDATGKCESYVVLFNVTNRYQHRGLNYRYRFCGTTLPAEVDSSSGNLHLSFYTPGLSAGQGFSLTYSTEEEGMCGGVLPTPSGVLVSPNFTQLTDTWVECLWSVELQENQTVTFNFDHLHLPGIVANFCRPSSLRVYTGVGYLGSYCGNMTEGFSFTTSFTPVKLKLVTPLDSPIGGFRATYNISNCGGNVQGLPVEEITSPGYPNNYPPSMNCQWQLSKPRGTILQLTFLDLRMEEDCTKDYVLIRNGGQLLSPSLGKFCGSHNVAPIVSTGEIVSIEFHSDAFGSAPGFKISTLEVQRGCGGLIHAPRGNISSPNYPARYDNNVECIWTIEYNPGNLVKLDFVGRFDIEMDGSCAKDYLQLEDLDAAGRWKTVEKKCGPTTPPPFISKSRKMRLTFRSNARIQGEGFNLQFRAECGGTFTDPSGEVMSPNYPGFYTDSLNCTYVIGKTGDYITLHFDQLFSIEGHDSCAFDYVEMFQGQIGEFFRQGKWCGDAAPASRTLPGPIIVRFVSDYVYTAHGFKLHYETMDCGAVYTDNSGFIGTTNTVEYLSFMSCMWHIVAPENFVIQLRFLTFDLEASHVCWRDRLTIYNGNSPYSPQIARLCGNDTPPTVKSTGRELTMTFTTDGRRNGLGFRAFYEVTLGEAQGCGGTLNSTSGTISFDGSTTDSSVSPQFLDCVWLIVVNEPDQVVTLTFQSFIMSEARNGSCEIDLLEIREYSSDGPVLGTYCGNRLPGQQTTSAPAIVVHFRSQRATGTGRPFGGFSMIYATTNSPCGASSLIATSESQTVTSPGYPSAYPANIRCKWTVRTNQTYGLTAPMSVSITDINIPCGGDYLEISSESTSYFLNTPPLRACGDQPPRLVQAKGVLHITFNSDVSENSARGFSLNFRIANCNTTYSDDNGLVTSQNYPSRINPNTNCSFNIAAPEGRTVALYFTRFEMGYFDDDQCRFTRMEVHDGLDKSSPLLGTFCGFYLPNPVFSTGRSLFVEVYNPSRQGFYFLTYTTTDKGRGCGGRFLSPEGSFSSPLYPRPYNVTGECVWHVSVPGYHSVRLHFTSFALANSTAQHCDTNYLELYEGPEVQQDKRVARFCGTDIPGEHELLTNEATVRLVTDASNDQPGFYARFESSDHVPVNVPIKIAQKFNN